MKKKNKKNFKVVRILILCIIMIGNFLFFGLEKENRVIAGEIEKENITDDISAKPLTIDYVYDYSNKRDPFKPLTEGKKEERDALEKLKKIELLKRQQEFEKEASVIPYNPLQEFDLSNLRLTMILWGEKGNYALMEGPDGKGYPVKEGAYIGKNLGFVKKISSEGLIIEEKFIDKDKGIKSKIIEIKLKKDL